MERIPKHPRQCFSVTENHALRILAINSIGHIGGGTSSGIFISNALIRVLATTCSALTSASRTRTGTGIRSWISDRPAIGCF